ncbi:MAG: universal stress protein [Thermodesulfobacteriota bacterium]
MKVSKRPEHLWVGINGKASGDHALRQAISIARWLHAGVTAVTVAPLYEGDLGLIAVGSVRNDLYKDIERSLCRALDIAQTHSFPVHIAAAGGGNIGCQLNRKAASLLKQSWIVIGASPTLSIAKWIAGPMLHAVVRGSSRPVLIIPEGTTLSGETVWIDCDGTSFEPSQSIHSFDAWFDDALEVASLFGPTRLLLAYPEDAADRLPPQWVRSTLQNDRINAAGSDSHPLLSIAIEAVSYGKRNDRWSSVLQRKPAFVVVSQRLFSIRRFSIGTWRIERMIRSLPCPLLVLPTPSTMDADRG